MVETRTVRMPEMRMNYVELGTSGPALVLIHGLTDGLTAYVANNGDDTVSVRSKLEKGLPRLVESLHEHLRGTRQGTVLSGGTYRPWIREIDFTIAPDTDSLDIYLKLHRDIRAWVSRRIRHAK